MSACMHVCGMHASMHMCLCMCVCYSSYVVVSRQLGGINFLLSLGGSWALNLSHQADSKKCQNVHLKMELHVSIFKKS